jgi:hypothetical protein
VIGPDTGSNVEPEVRPGQAGRVAVDGLTQGAGSWPRPPDRWQ